MSAQLDILLADQQALERRKAPPPPVVHATRADKIIAEGDAKRVAYRRDHPDADTTMVFGAQLGFLHGQVRALDAELSAFVPQYRRDQYLYTNLYVPELGGMVVCGYEIDEGEPDAITSTAAFIASGDPGRPGVAPSIELAEVWVNGRDIAGGVCEELAQQIIDRINVLNREGRQ